MKSGWSYNDVDKLLWILFVIVFDMLEAVTNAFVMGEYHKVVAMPILNLPIGKTNHQFMKTSYKHKVYECKSIIGFYIFIKKMFDWTSRIKKKQWNQKLTTKLTLNLFIVFKKLLLFMFKIFLECKKKLIKK